MLKDSYQRKIEYLRFSVIDRCNIRCQYCMPLEGLEKTDRNRILSFEEITRIVEAFVELGVKSVRLTGGEPLVRKNLPDLVAKLSRVEGLEDLLMTTNGILLKDYAYDLKVAGLTRINIHLDTLDPDRFREVTRLGSIEMVLEGIEAALAAGLHPIKINSVLQKGINDQEIESLVRFAAHQGLILRFIEIMPIGLGKNMNDQFLEAQYVLDTLAEKFTLVPFGKRLGPGPAEYYKVVELDSVIGLIHPVSKPFCDACNRVRMSADGGFQDCLAYEESTSLREVLRDPATTNDVLKEKIKEMITVKRSDHGGFLMPKCTATRGMYGIGG